MLRTWELGGMRIKAETKDCSIILLAAFYIIMDWLLAVYLASRTK